MIIIVGLAPANNLSDLVSAATARINLGLGTAATHAATDFDAAGAAAAAAAASLPLAGGTLTGSLFGTFGQFSSFATQNGNMTFSVGGEEGFSLKNSGADITFQIDPSTGNTAIAGTITADDGNIVSDGAGTLQVAALASISAAIGLGSFSVTAAGNATISGTNTGDQDLATLAPLIGSTINAQTGTSYALVLTDAGKLVTLSNASAITLTVPPNSTTAFLVNSRIDLGQIGAGQVTVSPGSGVTVNHLGSLTFAGQYAYGSLVKRATNTWDLIGGGAPADIVDEPGFTAFDATAVPTGKINGFRVAKYAAVITGFSFVVDAGTATVKVWKIAAGTAHPTVSNSINTSGVSISTGTALISTTVSDFTTTSVAAGDILAFAITAISGVKEITFQLKLTKA